jgi:hypothetical protein
MEIWFLVAAAFAASYLGVIAKHLGTIARQFRRIADQLEGRPPLRTESSVEEDLEMRAEATPDEL